MKILQNHWKNNIRIFAMKGSHSLLVAFFCANFAQAQSGTAGCGDPFVNHFGPWDYRTASKANLQIVENRHYGPGVESMTTPKTTMKHQMAGDVSYVLSAFPNHHRALITMVRLGEKYKSDPPPGTRLTVECFFDRAIRYRPDDTVVRSIYARFLNKNKRKDEALRQLELALSYAKDNPLSHYSIGTVYLELGEFERALAQAHTARAMGLQRPELENALKAAGHWKEPVQ